MSIEIERKFMVTGEFKQFAVNKYHIRQGYLTADPERNVRIRTRNDQAFITIKGKTGESGRSRFEFEKEITLEEAKDLFKLCISYIIEKERYIVPFKGHTFEVDVFEGQNKGLVIVEIELDDENEILNLPDWVGTEVTGIQEYYNSHLLFHPFASKK
jgi:CYTH domain-containing protein